MAGSRDPHVESPMKITVVAPSRLRSLVVVFALSLAFAGMAGAQVPSPQSFFGFRIGADRELADWPAIEGYFRAVGKASDRVRIVEAGPSTEGRTMIAAIISAPENLARLEEIRAANERLADPRTLPESEARALAARQKVVLAIGASIHSAEIGATQMANELLYELATGDDERTKAVLRDAVVILFPSLNPDGHQLVVDWYKRGKGTPLEGGPMPWLYHKYAGHDINRDAFMMNLEENRTIARFFYRQWHPQVFLAMHQMGARGPRMFVPPNYDPLPPNYSPLVWREAAVLGQGMALELERHGRSGVVSNAMFDYYWPGYEDSTPIGHNTVCLLTEVASARLATPMSVKPEDLGGSSPGLPQYRASINFPNPWPGGSWTLRDIVDYELDAVHGLFDGAVRYRKELLEDFYAMGKAAVDRGKAGGPFAFIVPPEQDDPNAAQRLVALLLDGAVEMQQAQEPFSAQGLTYPRGTIVIPLAQPYGAYVKTLLEKQNYPVRRLTPQSPPERPYDVAGWTLPWQMGVRVDTVNQPFELPLVSRVERTVIPPAQVWGDRRASWFIVSAPGTTGVLALNRLLAAGFAPSFSRSPIEANGYRYPAGSIVVAQGGKKASETVNAIARELGLRADGLRGKAPAGLTPLGHARVGLYKPWVENADEGWTRLLFERYQIPFSNLADADIRKGNLRASWDVIVLPDSAPQQLVAGARAESVPPEYAGGLGQAGVAALKAFVEAGGTLVCLNRSGQFAIESLGAPVKDVVRGLPADQFFCPGSVVRLDVDVTQPLAYGMNPNAGAFLSFGAAYEPDTTKSGADKVRAVARYASKDVLMSGWLEGEAAIAGRAAVVDAPVGSGRVVLAGIRPQHRAQSLATFRLLFNALYVQPSSKKK